MSVTCPYCGEPLSSEIHYCPCKPPMLKITWAQVVKFWNWIKGDKSTND